MEGETNVYAIGDCTNVKEEKMAVNAAGHAATVANNIYRDIKGQSKQVYKQGLLHETHLRFCNKIIIFFFFKSQDSMV